MKTIYLGLGSNIDPRKSYLKKAVLEINRLPQTKVTKKSSIYETKAVGYKDQDDFLNAVIKLESRLSPENLLKKLLKIEKKLGRIRTKKWGPRTIDIDILLYGDKKYKSENLKIPHSRMTERAFVLIPLAEIADPKNLIIDKLSLEYYIKNLDYDSGDISKYCKFTD
ncbi:2-amino-4-hydroxy-6-hydroxymethyldihydropteridine diphosphokinase [Halanaerobium sp. MA284_MarDTE_T2]|uniref:2-amino-4-hydroxy-6- hydroxymethyldihydropteridine diphosphokinase n=1 Tax=Halanaerobium sp. MA284_MarDTE_T2 TaxID=2183913 RepID=UPI000DF48F25|nr:2-amino-4-hydroxy-6-hydroxymethyldihydropteridine diphosphokinase [Halanaerobium sp. MA284_MarDTE_T2]